jgi:DeoR/GlpR family transcriptional regulator of sugar metabolism
VETIQDGETVMIESGSCCAIFAEALALIRKNITIITNSIFLTKFVCHLPKIQIILLGGCFVPESQKVIGSMTKTYAKRVYVDKLFLGADGFVSGQGFTGKNFHSGETVFSLSKYANKVYVLTEAEKFKRCGTYSMIKFDKLAGVFTDDTIPQEAEDELIRNNVQVYKVSSTDELVNIPEADVI